MRARCDVLFNRAVQRDSQRTQALQRCDVSFAVCVSELEYSRSAVDDGSCDFACTLLGVRKFGERFASARAADVMDNREQIVTAGLSLIDLHFHISGLHSDRFSTCARFMTFHDSEAARLCAVLQEGRCGLPKHAAICYGFDSRTRCATSIYFALPP